MRPRVVYLLALCTLAAPLSAQATPGHVYWVGFYQALPGKAGAYNKALTDVADPVLDELVRRLRRRDAWRGHRHLSHDPAPSCGAHVPLVVTRTWRAGWSGRGRGRGNRLGRRSPRRRPRHGGADDRMAEAGQRRPFGCAEQASLGECLPRLGGAESRGPGPPGLAGRAGVRRLGPSSA